MDKKIWKMPVGPYPSSRIGRCACLFAADGRLLRVLPNREAASRWTVKHFGRNARLSVLSCRSKVQVLEVFDDQMQRGLTSDREIRDLLWYGGVASDWKSPRAGKETGK